MHELQEFAVETRNEFQRWTRDCGGVALHDLLRFLLQPDLGDQTRNREKHLLHFIMQAAAQTLPK